MSAHVLLNLLNPLKKRILCIYLCHKKMCKKKSFIKQIAGLLLHNGQTQHEVIFITGFLVQLQGDQ